MKICKVSVILLVLASLTSCAHMHLHPMDMTQAIQNAKTPADHEALAKHYEAAAKDLQLKAQEYKKVLEKYETNAPHYGRQAQDLQDHTAALAHLYEQAAKANRDMADSHRKMAAEIK
ncbi:hypothetical protein [Nitrosomonas sp. Nm34]|uniref:hypothetical protein n=1 Tax=Nitrosomonas sp. Nm34 TaxID=1881055 RepID=UPI0008DFE117|nr:hypothetical protein [Nitrosomonas sp. Nm34]SFI73736.1 hypothetical protein SAMN05428978_103121 [Nitrosomonas sp. Nm34]